MRVKATIWAGFATALVLAVITALAYQSITRIFETNQREMLDHIVDEVRIQLLEIGRLVTTEAQLIAALPEIPGMISSCDRDRLLELLRDGYDIQHRHFGISVEQLNRIDGSVLLRLHNPSFFGDNVADTGEMVVTAHTTGEAQSGVEIGTSGLRVRGVAPVTDAGKIVGSIEFGIDMAPLLTALKAHTNADYAVLVDDRLFRSLATRAKIEDDDNFKVFNGLRIDSTTDLPLISKLAQFANLSIAKDRRYGEVEVDNVLYGSVTVPLVDYSGKAIGTIFAARSFEADQHQMRRNLVQMISMVAAGTVLMVAIILIVFNGMVLRPVTQLAGVARAWAEGKDAALPTGVSGPVADLVASLRALKARDDTVRREPVP